MLEHIGFVIEFHLTNLNLFQSFFEFFISMFRLMSLVVSYCVGSFPLNIIKRSVL